jgi:phytol kinase
MNEELLHTILLGACFLLLFAIAELLHYKKILVTEYSRKLVHTVTGILTLLFPIYLTTIWSVGFLCSSFLCILIFSKQYHFLKSINQINRKSAGSVLYPIIVFICFCAYKLAETKYTAAYTITLFYLPILILAICDPLAALIGKRYGIVKIPYYDHQKSWLGSLAFLVSAFTISFFFLITFNCSVLLVIGFALLIACISSITELISKDGWDNFTIPIVVLLTTNCFILYAL